MKGKRKLIGPHYETNPGLVKRMVSVASKRECGTLMTGGDRDAVIQQEVKEMLRWLGEKGFTMVEGYLLFNIVGSLKMMREIGIGVYTVTTSIPL
jgi:hypothetical protein